MCGDTDVDTHSGCVVHVVSSFRATDGKHVGRVNDGFAQEHSGVSQVRLLSTTEYRERSHVAGEGAVRQSVAYVILRVHGRQYEQVTASTRRVIAMAEAIRNLSSGMRVDDSPHAFRCPILLWPIATGHVACDGSLIAKLPRILTDILRRIVMRDAGTFTP